MVKKVLFWATVVAVLTSCKTTTPEPTPEPGEPVVRNEWVYAGVSTPIVNAAVEVKGHIAVFYLNKNVPLDAESQYGVTAKIELAVSVDSFGSEVELVEGSTVWVLNLLDTDTLKAAYVEVGTSTGGKLKVSKSGEEYLIEGTLNYEDGKSLKVYYKGVATDLVAFNNSAHSGEGYVKWLNNETEAFVEMPIVASCYKFTRFKQGDVYTIFLYSGASENLPIIDWAGWEEDEYGNPAAQFVYDFYNPYGTMLFVPASFVAEGRTIDLSVTKTYADVQLEEHRLTWGLYGMHGWTDFSDGSGAGTEFYAYEDKVKLGAAIHGYGSRGTVKIKRTGDVWDIEFVDVVARDTEASRKFIFSGKYVGTLESWGEYGNDVPGIWCEYWGKELFNE
jgi:hypothetical protein